MKNKIILSICIPTYNRFSYLETTILSIVNQQRFQQSNDVEIVISDNCSNDETKNKSLGFVKLYGDKIRYYRNDDNIKDLNFEKALSYGKGLFLKLNNDTLKHHDGSLNNILQTIDENKEDRNILFFSNGFLEIKHNVLCDNLSSFLDKVSYWSGWIGAFGIWREDFITFNDFNKCSHLQLTQIDVLFRLINSQKSVLVNNSKLFDALPPSKKGGYDLLTVFLDNYLFLLSEQLKNKTLSEKVFISEKRKLLLQFICPWLVNIKTNPKTYYFTSKKSFSRIYCYYRKDLFTMITFVSKYFLLVIYRFARKGLRFLLGKNQKSK